MAFDFDQIFKEQIGNAQPYTEGNVRQVIGLLAHTLKTRDLVEKSKYLKTKVGVRRLTFTLIDKSGKPHLDKTWEDEFDILQNQLGNYDHVGYNGDLPIFEIRKQ